MGDTNLETINIHNQYYNSLEGLNIQKFILMAFVIIIEVLHFSMLLEKKFIRPKSCFIRLK